MSAFTVFFFLFNFTILMSTPMHLDQHTDSDAVSMTDLSEDTTSQEINNHLDMEHCGVTTCNVLLTNTDTIASLNFSKKTLFAILESDFVSLSWAPPSRPPSA